MNAKIKEFAKEASSVFNRAVENAQQQNRDKGLRNVYSRRGKLYFEPVTTDKSK